MAASESKLSALHEKVAEVLIVALEGTKMEFEDEEGNKQVSIMSPSAAMIQAAAAFLKQNNITCQPSDDNALGDLKKRMEDREKRRKATKLDLAESREQGNFLAGLPN